MELFIQRNSFSWAGAHKLRTVKNLDPSKITISWISNSYFDILEPLKI